MTHPIRSQYDSGGTCDHNVAYVWTKALERDDLLYAFSKDPEPAIVHQLHTPRYREKHYYQRHTLSKEELDELCDGYDEFVRNARRIAAEHEERFAPDPDAVTVEQHDSKYKFVLRFRRIWCYTCSENGPMVYDHTMPLLATRYNPPEDVRRTQNCGNISINFMDGVPFRKIQLALTLGFKDSDGFIYCNSLQELKGAATKQANVIAKRLSGLIESPLMLRIIGMPTFT